LKSLGNDISPKVIRDAAIELDKNLMFCSDGNLLDSTAGITNKIIRELR